MSFSCIQAVCSHLPQHIGSEDAPCYPYQLLPLFGIPCLPDKASHSSSSSLDCCLDCILRLHSCLSSLKVRRCTGSRAAQQQCQSHDTVTCSSQQSAEMHLRGMSSKKKMISLSKGMGCDCLHRHRRLHSAPFCQNCSSYFCGSVGCVRL